MKPNAPMEYSSNLSRARSIADNGAVKEAVSILEKLEISYPDQSPAFQYHSFILLRNKRYLDAAYVAERGLVNNPNEPSLKRNLAEALSHIPGEDERARNYFSELLKDYSHDIKFLSTYADFLVRRDHFEEARNIYNSILTRDVSIHRKRRAVIDLARSYRFEHQPDQGLEILEKNPAPDDPFWLREKGSCLLELGHKEGILPLFKEARELIKSAPDRTFIPFISQLEPLEKSAEALGGQWKETALWLLNKHEPLTNKTKGWSSVRRAIKDREEYGEAIEFFLGMLSTFPADLELGYELHRIIFGSNIKQEDIARIIERALTNAPQNPCILEIAAQCNFNGQAKEYWAKAWSEISSSKSIEKTTLNKMAEGYSQFLRRENAFEDALAILNQARTLSGYDWDVELERAICLARTDQPNDAIDLLKSLDKQVPNNPVVLDQLGVCLRTIGSLDEALDVYERKQLVQDDIPGLQGLARTLYELGRTEDAIKVFETILERDPEDAEAILHLVTALLDTNQVERAQKLSSKLTPSDLAKRGREIIESERRISELNRSLLEKEAEIEQSRKLAYLGTMATATAHELNQPIGIIRALTDSALSDISSGLLLFEETRPLLEKILQQTTRLAKIIDNLRSFARSDRTKREPVNLNELIIQVTQMFTEQFRHRNIELVVETNYNNPPPIAWANPIQLEEVLINLLSNARDAVDGQAAAMVKVVCWRHARGGCGFSVEDNGPGLSPEYKQKMYTPFVSTKPTEKGTGLGLFISQRLISDLGGRLFFEEREAGIGARCVVHLPATKREENKL